MCPSPRLFFVPGFDYNPPSRPWKTPWNMRKPRAPEARTPVAIMEYFMTRLLRARNIANTTLRKAGTPAMTKKGPSGPRYNPYGDSDTLVSKPRAVSPSPAPTPIRIDLNLLESG